jgi:serine/threonine protein kinase
MCIYHSYKSDIWSLGLVLLECATQKFPYENVHSHIDVSINNYTTLPSKSYV